MLFVNWRQRGVGHKHFWSLYFHMRVVLVHVAIWAHCMPQSMSLFHMRVVLGCLQFCHGRKAAKLLNGSLQVSEFKFTHVMFNWNYLTILWWSKTIWCLPQRWTLVPGVLEVSSVLQTILPLHTFITRRWQTWPTFDQLDYFRPTSDQLGQLLTNFWPTFDQFNQFLTKLLTNLTNFWPICLFFLTNLTKLVNFWPTFDKLLTNFTNSWPIFHQLDQLCQFQTNSPNLTNVWPTWPIFDQLDPFLSNSTNFWPSWQLTDFWPI